MSDVASYSLRLGDDALVLSHRLAQWSSSAPELEEDIALTNIALDLLGQARALLTVAGQRESARRDEDDLAYLRDEREFTNIRLVELENGDFAHTIIRQLLVSTYQLGLYAELTASSDPDLAAIAGKAVKEVTYHRDHAVKWTLRLGDGTDESHTRAQSALETLWPYRHELFERDELTARLVEAGVAADPTILRATWEPSVTNVLHEATLAPPKKDVHRPTGGRRGRHSELLGTMLAEMQWLHRSHPGASW
ncbi:MAG TPA: 1,2-phenylacetyl-CoA epoxidase subunit PaaC [Solirubrobacteraceae bacterium]|jgi:ring-1,2-phenylacetyl-CoA epoxidase subunit PaaC|nr:1,2-phenylacetyl-CoA epoxidase subunit PaaC [Solirubrobacteraceae bacterium]